VILPLGANTFREAVSPRLVHLSMSGGMPHGVEALDVPSVLVGPSEVWADGRVHRPWLKVAPRRAGRR